MFDNIDIIGYSPLLEPNPRLRNSEHMENSVTQPQPTKVVLSKDPAPLVDNSSGTSVPVTTAEIGTRWSVRKGAKIEQPKRRFGLGRRKPKNPDTVDLDLTMIALNARQRPVAYCDSEEQPFGNALVHGGDDTTGGGTAEENELIRINLLEIPDPVKYLLGTLVSFKAGITFAQVSQVSFRIRNTAVDSRPVVAENYLEIEPQNNSALLVLYSRNDDGTWSVSNFAEEDSLMLISQSEADRHDGQHWRALVERARANGLLNA
jgi:hypothetical protein